MDVGQDEAHAFEISFAHNNEGLETYFIFSLSLTFFYFEPEYRE